MHTESVVLYPSGKLKAITYLKDCVCDGMQRTWYEDGKPQRFCSYSNGKLHGRMTKWYPDGRICGNYDYRDGLLHGIIREWDKSGNIVFERVMTLFGGDDSYLSGLATLIRLKMLNANEISMIDDSEIRRICVGEVGYEIFYSQLEHLLIDQEGEDELVMINWSKDEDPLYLLKIKCPSTGTFYTLRVPPDMKTIKEAVAWTFGVSENEYLPEIET